MVICGSSCLRRRHICPAGGLGPRGSNGSSSLPRLPNSSQMTMFGVGLRVTHYDSICPSHRINSSDVLCGDPGGSRTAWRSFLRGRRRSLCSRCRCFCGSAHCIPWLHSTSFFRAKPAQRTHHPYPVDHPSYAAAFRSAKVPAATCHSRPSGL